MADFIIDKTLKKILPFFSYVFHPIFIPILAALFYFIIGIKYYNSPQIFLVLVQILVLTVVIPMLLYLILYLTKRVKSLVVANVKQRRFPLFVNMLLICILLFKSSLSLYFPHLYLFFWGELFTVFLALILVLLHHKASLHMAGITGITMFTINLSILLKTSFLPYIIIFVLLSGIVATSRLYMKAHTPKELCTGTLIGVLPQLLWLFMTLNNIFV